MGTSVWVLPSTTEIFALTDELIEVSKKPVRDAIHAEVLANAIQYHDMAYCGDSNTENYVFQIAETPSSTNSPMHFSFWGQAARERISDLRTAGYEGSNLLLDYDLARTGEYILTADGLDEGIKAVAKILGEEYLYSSKLFERDPKKIEKLNNLSALKRKGNNRSLQTTVLGYPDRVPHFPYLAYNKNIPGPSREQRAKSLTNMMVELSDYTKNYDTLYPAVLGNLSEMDRDDMLTKIKEPYKGKAYNEQVDS